MTAESRFVQIRRLASYPETLLNRDDTGLAKRLPFGGARRTRGSSKCLLRHWRMAGDEYALRNLNVPTAVRSKEIVDREIAAPLTKKGIAPDVVVAVSKAFVKAHYGKNAADPKERQALILGWPEVRYLATEAERLAVSAADANAADAAAKEFLTRATVRRTFRRSRTRRPCRAASKSRFSGGW